MRSLFLGLWVSTFCLGAQAAWQSAETAPKILQSQKQDVFALDISKNGQYLASASFDGTTRVWNTQTWEEIYNFPGHANWIGDVAIHPSEPLMVTAGLDGRLQLWNLTNGKKVETLETFEKALLSVRFSPDGKYLAVAGKSKSISLFDWQSRTLRTRFEGHSGSVVNLAFSPDSKYLASVAFNDLAVLLWDLEQQKLAHRLVDHREELYAVDFSPDGQYLASAGADRIIRLWSMSTLLPVQELAGHLKPVWAIRFHPNSKTLVSGSIGDQTLRFWSIPGGANTEILTDVGQNTYDLAFLPTGETLFSSHREGRIKIWEDIAARPTLPGNTPTLEALRIDIAIAQAEADRITLQLSQKNVPLLEGVSLTVEVLNEQVKLLSPTATFFLPKMEQGTLKTLALPLQTPPGLAAVDLRLSIESQTPEGRVVLPLRVPLKKETP